MMRSNTRRRLVLYLYVLLLVAIYGPEQHVLAEDRGDGARKRRTPLPSRTEKNGSQQESMLVAKDKDDIPQITDKNKNILLRNNSLRHRLNIDGKAKHSSPDASASKTRIETNKPARKHYRKLRRKLNDCDGNDCESLGNPSLYDTPLDQEAPRYEGDPANPTYTSKSYTKKSQSKSKHSESSKLKSNKSKSKYPSFEEDAADSTNTGESKKMKSHSKSKYSKSKSQIETPRQGDEDNDYGDGMQNPPAMSYPANPPISIRGDGTSDSDETIIPSDDESLGSGSSGKGSSGKGESGKGSSGKGSSGKGSRRHRHLQETVQAETEHGTPNFRQNHGHLRKSTPGDAEQTIGEYQHATQPTPKLRKHESQMVLDSPQLLQHPIIQDLQSVETRYYMYDDCDILQCDLLDQLRKQGTPKNNELDHISTDAKAEADIIQALQDHPLRTFDPEEASMYIVPLPFAELISYGCQWEDCRWFEDSFEALINHRLFQKNHGNDHVMISQHWVTFNKRFPTRIPAMAPMYRKISNVTVAMHYDPFGSAELAANPEQTHGSGFSSLFQWEGNPLTKAFSIGLIGTTDIPLTPVSMEKFASSKFFAFYHTRTTPLAFGSTKYRMALLSKPSNDTQMLPESSIGVDIPKNEWVDHFLSSKFCLSIRGDTPHSHTLLHSLRAGCIPVVISDFYEEYAPSFKSVLSMKDWVIVIDEADFLADPFGQIRALDDLPLTFIEEKIANVSLAQSIVLSESPYFVPAFLRESINANTLSAPVDETDMAVEKRWSSLTIDEVTHSYLYPTSLIGSVELFHQAPIIIGVISSLENDIRRHLIRESWGKDHRVFFVVSGGAWEDVSEEFTTFGDILWIEGKDSEADEDIRASIFLKAVEDHVESYGYAIPTRDDSYVQVDKIEMLMRLYRPDYWGACKASQSVVDKSIYLDHTFSRKFAHCAVKRMEEGGFAQHGVSIVDECGMSCMDTGWDYRNSWSKSPIEKFVSGRDLFYLHERVIWDDESSPYYEGIAKDMEEGFSEYLPI